MGSDDTRPSTLIVSVIQIVGHCPMYEVGDAFRIANEFRLVAEKPLCMHSLASLLPYYVALSRGLCPVALGLAREGRVAFVQCPDPCERTGGGTVTFAVTVQERG